MGEGKCSPGPWKAIENSWQYTTIYDAHDHEICRLDLERFEDLNEETQDKYEAIQRADAAAIVRACDHLAALRRAKAGWTREKPTAAGWYWWRQEKGMMEVPREVVYSPFYRGLVTQGERLIAGDGEWLGPITPTDRQQGRVAGAQDVLESFKKHHDACNDFRHCECAGGFWYEHIGKAWMDEKAAQAAQDEKGVGDGKV